MSTAAQGAGPITFINVFELDADKVDAFLVGWHKRAEVIAQLPGFRSFRIHRALVPGAPFQLINVAEWDSIEALTAATGSGRFEEMVRAAEAEFGAVNYPGVFLTELEVTAPPG